MKIIAATLSVFILVISSHSHAQSGLCDEPHKSKLHSIDVWGVIRICQRLNPRYDSSILELPADIIVAGATVIGAIPNGAKFRENNSGNSITFSAKGNKGYENYVLCSAARVIHSEIPGKGRYVKHGITSIDDSSVTYAWDLRRRRYRNVRFVADVAVTFIHKNVLEDARRVGMCSTQDYIKNALYWRQ